VNKGSYHWGTVTKDNGEAYRRVNNGAATKYPLPSEGKELLPVGDILRVIRRLLWVVILVALLTAGIAVGVSLLQPPAYDATALVVVRPTQTSNSQAGFSNTITGLQTLAHEMAVVGLTPSMVEAIVHARAELPSPVSAADLHNNLKVEQLADTRFIQLSYRGTEPNQTQAVTNLAAEAFTRQMPEVSGVATDAVVTVSEPATLPNAPQSPNPLRNGLVALAMGLILGVGLALLLDRFAVGSWQSPEEVESVLGVPTFGAIPDFEEANHKQRRTKQRT
jgi:capsular polysaccharide biosynthesis protein